MDNSAVHISTQEATRSPIRYFGDDYLENMDFLAKLDNDCTKGLAIRGIDAPEPMLAPYIFNAPFKSFLIPLIREIQVNKALKTLIPERRLLVKERLKKTGNWEFPGESASVKTSKDQMYS